MAIVETSIIWPVRHFSAGLDAIKEAVFQVSETGTKDNNSFYTGWLITDNILICPDFAWPEKDTKKTFQATKDGISYEADYLGGLLAESQGFSLIKLKDFSGKHLPIYMRNVVPETSILIMQYPPQQPDASFSFGHITEGAVPLLSYVASTVPGSAGGPVIHAGTWEVMGIHLMASVEKYNSGVTIGSVLDALTRTSAWPEIRDTHHLIEIQPASNNPATETGPPPPSETMLRAALSWQFDPAQLSELERDDLSFSIIDPAAPIWTLKTPDRQRLLQSAGVAKLRSLKALPGSEKHAGQFMIDEVLSGRLRLTDVLEEQLPFYFQITQWLRPLLPQLPSASMIRKRTEQLRLRSRLRQISGDDFEGRSGELRMLRQWYVRKRSGPLVLSGLGGIGKSALLAHFALTLDPPPLLIWLDFDRADLAPDDHRSLAEAFYEQVAIQLDTELDLSHAEDTRQTDLLAKTLAGLVKDNKTLVILDGFEVAQHVEQYHDIWNFFEVLLDQIPEMKIIISGRSDVPNLILGGRPGNNRKLEGLSKADARVWLRRHVKLPAAQQMQVVEVSRGIPLILRLATSFMRKGGEISDLLGSRRPILIEGYLYQRVLDRVIDNRIKELSKDALVLRKINLPLISAALSRRLPPNMSPEEAFKSLSREMGLVNEKLNLTTYEVSQNSEDLYLKPEVRNATLALLEESEPDRVAEIDQLAMAYYRSSTDMADPDNAAEYIYHALRLGRTELAEKAWTSASYYLLRNSVDEIPDRNARHWLEKKLDAAYQNARQAQLFWENDSLEKIRSLLSRGHSSYIQEILDQRSQRTKGSLLYIYDAWQLWKGGSVKQALKVCKMALKTTGRETIDPRKYIFAAFLAKEAGDRRQSDRLLYQIEQESVRSKTNNYRGARLRLFSSIEDELKYEKMLLNLRATDAIDNRLALFTATDFILKTLKEGFLDNGRESNFRLYKNIAPPVPEELLTYLNEGTFRTFLIYPSGNCSLGEFERLNRDWKEDIIRSEAVVKLNEKDRKIILDMAIRTAFRWYLLTLPDTLERIADAFEQRDKSTLAVADLLTVAVFENLYFALIANLKYTRYSANTSISELLGRSSKRLAPIEPHQQQLLRDLIKHDAPNLEENMNYLIPDSEPMSETYLRNIFDQLSNYPVIQYALYPEPLDLLAKQALGLPENVPL